MGTVDSDQKYITFKRNEFFTMMGYLALPPWTDEGGELIGQNMDCAVIGGKIQTEVAAIELSDAVIIRRQDVFASPCLFTYANMISLVADNVDDRDKAYELQRIADYFHDQAVLAADEGRKLPDV